MLSFSKGTNYSILVLDYLSSLPENVVKSNAEIAEILGLPVDFLSKILQKLTHSGLVRSIKGTNGGYALAENIKNISLKQIIDSVEGPSHFVNDLKNSLVDYGRSGNSKKSIELMKKFESELNYLMERIDFIKN